MDEDGTRVVWYSIAHPIDPHVVGVTDRGMGVTREVIVQATRTIVVWSFPRV